jgi:hypothetical protein
MPVTSNQWDVTYVIAYYPRYVSTKFHAKGSALNSMNLVMCNIMDYVGAKDVTQILLDGLERLDHQSYDASGMARRKDERFTIEKQLGRVKHLSNAISASVNF